MRWVEARAYAFNVMRGDTAFTNVTAGNATEKTDILAFDFCYTEVKKSIVSKRVNSVEKNTRILCHPFQRTGLQIQVDDYNPTIDAVRDWLRRRSRNATDGP